MNFNSNLVCSIIEHIMEDNQDHFNVLRTIGKSKNITQRQLATKLGFSLGKLNYCVKALMDKGFIKINNFKKNPNKSVYMYILTPKGISAKAKLTVDFMKRKIIEYDELKAEIEDDEKKN